MSLAPSSFLSEVDYASILKDGALHCYQYPLNWLPTSRLWLPRSGLERSDLIWKICFCYFIERDSSAGLKSVAASHM